MLADNVNDRTIICFRLTGVGCMKLFLRLNLFFIVIFFFIFGCASAGNLDDYESIEQNSIEYFLFQLDSLEKASTELLSKYPVIFDQNILSSEFALFREEAVSSDIISSSLLEKFQTYQKDLLLKNPELNFDDVLYRQTANDVMPLNWTGNPDLPKSGYDNQIRSFSLQDAELDSEVFNPGIQDTFVGDVVLHYDAQRFLFSGIGPKGNWELFEYNLIDKAAHQVSTAEFSEVDNYNGIYLPDDRIVFCSTACMAGVPCDKGNEDVANLYTMNNDGSSIRQLTYEQDADWYPYVMNSGKVMYLRWEYTDNSHYFTRILMNMNPDGTEQKALYGSNSYWPNTMFYAKQLPKSSNQFVAIVSGHHGTNRAGELVLFDTSLGVREIEGAVMRLGAINQNVRNVIKDQLVDNIWPKYLHPYPLTETTFLTASKTSSKSNWSIFLVDTYGNRVKIKDSAKYNLLEPVPVMTREVPPVIPDRIDTSKKDATVYIQDVYFGEGLKNVPRGTVKQLRISTYGYTLRGHGSHDLLGVESAWDSKIILGTVDVEEDGSVIFKMPANLPITIQPLDKDGAALQLMRSWTTAMPGEYVSCLGCHENSNDVPAYKRTMASRKEPVELTPVFDIPTGIGFETEIQPVLDRNCISCHDGSGNKPDFKNTSSVGKLNFSQSYHELHPYVRRPGPESDFYMLPPMEYHVSTSELFQLLDNGHHGVELAPLDRRRLTRWIDLNVPYFPSYRSFFNSPEYKRIEDKALEIRRAYNSNVVDNSVDPATVNRVETDESTGRFVNDLITLDDQKLMKRIQTQTESSSADIRIINKESSLILESNMAIMKLIPVASGVNTLENGEQLRMEMDLMIATTEVTNAFYNLYDVEHDSRYYDQQWKDHIGPGYPANRPKQPVIRVNWYEATLFCEWLSEKIGRKVRLLTEDEWKYAALAGSHSEFHFGDESTDFSLYENLADSTLVNLAVFGIDPQPTTPTIYNDFLPRVESVNDGQLVGTTVASYQSNPFGLYDMHGNAQEWVSTRKSGEAIAKGGSFRDRPKRAGVNHQIYYQPYQKVFNVSFRFCIEP